MFTSLSIAWLDVLHLHIGTLEEYIARKFLDAYTIATSPYRPYWIRHLALLTTIER